MEWEYRARVGGQDSVSRASDSFTIKSFEMELRVATDLLLVSDKVEKLKNYKLKW